MTETIDSANAAASTLFLGHNGEWWDFWLIISVGFAALAGTTPLGALLVGLAASNMVANISSDPRIPDDVVKVMVSGRTLVMMPLPKEAVPKNK